MNDPHTVSEGALLRRINRRLQRTVFQRVLKLREDSRAYFDLGRFYVIDCSSRFLVDSHVDLEELARELGVLRPSERLAA